MKDLPMLPNVRFARRSAFVLAALLAAGFAHPVEALTIAGVTQAEPAASGAVGTYAKVELAVTLSGVAATNFYNPDPARGGIDLSATFTGPAGATWRVNGFYNGSGWRIRFAPNAAGTWTYALAAQDSGGAAAWSGGTFAAVRSGFLGWARYDGNVLRFSEGKAVFAVGHNTGWQYNVEQPALTDMAAKGEDLLSFWLAVPWAQPSWASATEPYWDDRAAIENAEQGIGNYNQAACAYLDGVVARAEAAGIYLLPSVWTHGQLRDVGHPWGTGWWANNAYSHIGITASDFFKTTDANGDTLQWRCQKNFYRYLLARWGYSRAIAGWVAMCEIDGTSGFFQNPTQAEAWCVAVRDFFRANDPFRRNAAGESPLAFFRYESPTWMSGLDLRATDSYNAQYDNIGISSLIATETTTLRASGKPSFHGEFGGNVSGGATQPAHLHNGIWPGAAAGAALTPLLWCDGGSFPMLTPAMQDQLRCLSEFMAGIDYYGTVGLSPATVSFNSLVCRGWGMKLTDRGFAWAQNKLAGGTMGGQTLTVAGLLPGLYTVAWYDAWTSGLNAIRVDTQTVGTSGTLTATIPTLARADIALRFRRNSAPVAGNDAYSLAQCTTLTVPAPGVLANDSDPEHDPLTAIRVAAPVNGLLSLAANGSFSYSPRTGFFGTDTFTYQASDGISQSGIATVTLTVRHVNHPPVANSDAATTPQGSPVTIAVLANDSDPDGDALTVTAVTQGSSGTVVNNGNGTVKYTPKAGFAGSDAFAYTISDGQTTATASVTVTVTPIPNISGRIALSTGVGVGSIAVKLEKNVTGKWVLQPGTVSDGTGYYQFGPLLPAPYRVTPSSSLWKFTPSSISVTVTSATDRKVCNFKAARK